MAGGLVRRGRRLARRTGRVDAYETACVYSSASCPFRDFAIHVVMAARTAATTKYRTALPGSEVAATMKYSVTERAESAANIATRGARSPTIAQKITTALKAMFRAPTACTNANPSELASGTP